jgi:hypothetical protein
MAHFAKLDENNNVLAVHVVNNNVITIDGNESEQAGIDFLTSLHGHTLWKQTSYNGNIRKNYAGIGFTYNEQLDAFVPPKPFSSWLLNENTCQWYAPISYPQDGYVHPNYGGTGEGKMYLWNEETLSWVEAE